MNVLLGLAMIGLGLLSILWGTSLWERVKNDSKVRLLSVVLTPMGARVFYVFVGVLGAVLGLLIATGVMRR